MSLSPRHIRIAAYVVSEELARRRRSGVPIPAWALELHRALACELADHGHESSAAPTQPATLETVAERDQRLGVRQRTVRRYARRTGAQRLGHAWIFEN